jgi:hypothetical protein
MDKKDNKRTFENVKIYGYDPSQESNQYDRYYVTLYLSQEQSLFIDSFLDGSSSKKCDVNRDGEFVYTAKSKQPIPIFTPNGDEIFEPINNAFIADVRLKFDEFTNDKEELIKYIKPTAIRIVEIIPNEAVRIFIAEREETFEEMFGIKAADEIGQPNNISTHDQEGIPPMDDLPF